MKQLWSPIKLDTKIIKGLLIALSIVLVGCSRTITIIESERYNDQMVEIKARDSVIYKLASGWKVDSLNNVSGRGLKVVRDSTEKFKGAIQFSDIEQLVVVDSVTPAIIICIGAAVGLSLIWLFK
jgi:hypothetical protein